MLFFFFFFHDTATTEIYTLSLHDALPISGKRRRLSEASKSSWARCCAGPISAGGLRLSIASPLGRSHVPDRKSTRLNSSHSSISYAVFCLKKKKTEKRELKEHH